MKDEIILKEKVAEEMPRESREEDPSVGKWYWITDDDGDRWLGCVTHMGSNYVKMTSTYGGDRRIHFDNFWKWCEYVPDALEIVHEKTEECRARIGELTNEVQLLTSRLGVAPSLALSERSDTEALAVRAGEPMPEYREALVKAKKDKLPALFEEIKKTSEKMERWLKAEAIPLKAARDKMDSLINSVDRRILAVDLYAGLSEEAALVRDGEPAEMTEPIRLLQRRHYMDEECLAQYRHGGMEFKDIEAFDGWLASDENRERILPFPRCMVAFQVRRKRKERHGSSLSDFIRIMELEKLDTVTFLYIRNGDQVWRVNTKIDFGERLFPDSDRQLISSGNKLWAKVDWKGVKGFISDDRYRYLREEDARNLWAWRAEKKKWDAEEAAGMGRDDHSFFPPSRPDRQSEDYRAFVPDDLYYDDMMTKLSNDIEEHNRVVMILQGLIDRSEVLHPHPPWKIWTADGFQQAIRLVYDQDRALVAGEKPDFEAYRKKLNESLGVGSITIGQERAWMIKEAKRENARRDRNWRRRDERYVKLYSPYGNPGPGYLAEVVKFMPRARKCTYHWKRDRLTYDYSSWGREKDPHIHAQITCKDTDLINVSAYKPGDFRRFFDDPRTRAEYLEWAPMLLMAEEYHAGNRTVGTGKGSKEDNDGD